MDKGMCFSIVEGMALTGKALEINTALRHACEAVKLAALSERIECPYVLPDFKAPQCPGVPATHTDEPVEMQYKRILVFLRSIQQGIIPPTNIATLSEEEEKAFKQEIQIAIKAHDDAKENVIPIDEWLVHTVFRTPNPKSFVTTINTIMKPFITGGGNGTTPLPILVSGCKYDGHPHESTFTRFISLLRKSDDELKYYFEYTDGKAKAKNIYDATQNISKSGWSYTFADETASNKLNDISILVFSRGKYDNLYGSGKADDNVTNLTYDRKTTIRGLFYIMTDNTLKYDIDTTGLLDYVIQGADLSNRYIIKHLFERKSVIDIHPWLMYLLLITPTTYNAFMKEVFDGNMALPDDYSNRLAYYIIAHSVANTDKYKDNPGLFYSKPFDEKKPEMKEALKLRGNELKRLIDAGYAWLGKPRSAPTISAVEAQLDGQPKSGVAGMFSRLRRSLKNPFRGKQKGGKTRKVRFSS